MLTPENAGCPRCFAPLKFQEMRFDDATTCYEIEIDKNGVETSGKQLEPIERGGFHFYCNECESAYEELHQRNFHDMAAYVAAQEKKDIAARKAQSKKKKKS